MKTISLMTAVAILVGVCALCAQDANPISANLKGSWTDIRDLLTKMAAKMPTEDYRFKPTPEVEDFGQRMAHIVGSNMQICALLRGDQKSVKFSATPSKPEVVAAMKEANAECDAVFNSLTDADLVKTFDAGRAGRRLKFPAIDGFVLQHSQEMYGYMAVYLRLKGIVPPSSERNER
jgi:hypothetical protein